MNGMFAVRVGAWKLIEGAGCRGLKVGGAEVSEMHTNFLINAGDASGADIEELGETVRARVYETSGVRLEWEIIRLGEFLPGRAVHAAGWNSATARDGAANSRCRQLLAESAAWWTEGRNALEGGGSSRPDRPRAT